MTINVTYLIIIFLYFQWRKELQIQLDEADEDRSKLLKDKQSEQEQLERDIEKKKTERFEKKHSLKQIQSDKLGVKSQGGLKSEKGKEETRRNHLVNENKGKKPQDIERKNSHGTGSAIDMKRISSVEGVQGSSTEGSFSTKNSYSVRTGIPLQT